MKDLTELVQKWEAEAQRLWGIADLGSSPTESAEANAEAGVYSMCADQLEKAIAARADVPEGETDRMNRTDIEYLDYTLNPLAMRCTPISEGCTRCWHIRMAKRMAGNPRFPDKVRAAYAGKSAPVLIEKRLDEPSRLRKPARIGVQFMGDLFHKNVSTGNIQQVFDLMSQTPQHTYLILTKRPHRMKMFFVNNTDVNGYLHTWDGRKAKLPLPNVWGLVTAENQEQANLRIPLLLQCQFAVRGVSIEPMLSRIDISPYLGYNIQKGETGNAKRKGSLLFGSARRVEDRSGWSSMDEEEARMEKGGTQNAAGLPSSQEDGQWNQNPHGSASSCLSSLQGRDTRGTDDQSPEWEERRQQARELGSGNLLRESETCLSHRVVESGRGEESRMQIIESAGRGDQREIRQGRHNSDETRRGIRCDLSDNIGHSEREAAQEPGRRNGGLHSAAAERETAQGFSGAIQFVIVGGETGPGARTMDPGWARGVRDQCKEAGVPFFFKQMSNKETIPDDLMVREWPGGAG